MAKRLLLTLLALLGLAAQIAPAQARVCAGAASAVGEVVLGQRDERASAARAIGPLRQEPPASADCSRASSFAVYAVPAMVPVLPRIDRARE